MKENNLQKNNIHVTPFIDDMTTAYAAADVIISRAGALAQGTSGRLLGSRYSHVTFLSYISTIERKVAFA